MFRDAHTVMTAEVERISAWMDDVSAQCKERCDTLNRHHVLAKALEIR